MYFIIILLILVFMLICYKTENFSCKRELPVNMHRLYAHNDIKNLLKNYKPKPDILHRSNPYYYLIKNINLKFKPIPINIHKLNIEYAKVNNTLIKNKSKQIINAINEIVKKDAQINKRRYRCRVRPVKILPPLNFKLNSITNKRAYLIKDRFTVHNNKIYTIYTLTIYNTKDKYSNFLIFNIHLIDSQIANVKYMTLKSTDKYYLRSGYDYDSKYNTYRDYDTTNRDDDLLPEIFDNYDLYENDIIKLSGKKLKKQLAKAENKLLNQIEENSLNDNLSNDNINRIFEDRDIVDELNQKRKLQNLNQQDINEINEINDIIQEIAIDDNDEITIDNDEITIDNDEITIDDNDEIAIDDNDEINWGKGFRESNLDNKYKKKIRNSNKLMNEYTKSNQINYNNITGVSKYAKKKKKKKKRINV